MGDEFEGEYDPKQDPDYDWSDPEITDEKLEALKQERQVMDIDFEEQARRIMREALPGAALGVVALSRNAQNDNVKFNAQKYIMEYFKDGNGDSGGLLEDLVGDLVKNAEKLANGSV
jgi:hypothetical protein